MSFGNRIKMVEVRGANIPFYWDSVAGLWLSVNEDQHQFGINGNPGSGTYLRHTGNVAGTATGREFIGGPSHDFLLGWVSASAGNTPSCTLEFLSGASVVHSETWTSAQQVWTPASLETSGFWSVRIASVTTAPNNPIVTIGVRWRLP